MLIELFRQRSRPYLFSNTLASAISATSLEVIKMLTETTEYRDRLEENTRYFREDLDRALKAFDMAYRKFFSAHE